MRGRASSLRAGRAAAGLAPTYPDLRLTLIGDLGVPDRVTFAGAKTQGEVAETLGTANLFVLPSFAEGVPVVLMEAMASRRPVVTARIAGIPELVEDGVSGRLVPPGNIDALSEAVAVVLADPDGARAMGEAGLTKVEAKFDIVCEAAKIARLFDGGAD